MFNVEYDPNNGHHFIVANGIGQLLAAKAEGPKKMMDAFTDDFQELTANIKDNEVALLYIDLLKQDLAKLHTDLLGTSSPKTFKPSRKIVWEINELVKCIKNDFGLPEVIEKIKSTEEILFGVSFLPTSPLSLPHENRT